MSTPPADHARLRGVRVKIERAKQHIRDLDAEVRRVRSLNPYVLRSETDPDTGEYVLRVEVRRQIPLSIAAIAGDAVHNLRSALDHLAWQLVEANGGTPTDKTGYPIRNAPKKYKSMDKAIVQGIPDGALKLIEATQPYQRGYRDLGRLHEVDNFDKHRLLFAAAFSVTSLSHELSPGPGGVAIVESFTIKAIPTRMLQDGQELARTRSVEGHQSQINSKLTYEIALVQPEVVQGEPILPFLAQPRDLVESVVNQFIPFL